MMRFDLYGDKHKHTDACHIEKTATGWRFSYASASGDCDKECHPQLSNHLQNNYIEPGIRLGMYMAILWNKAEAEGWGEDTIQKYLDELSVWQNRAYVPTPATARPKKTVGRYIPFDFSFEKTSNEGEAK